MAMGADDFPIISYNRYRLANGGDFPFEVTEIITVKCTDSDCMDSGVLINTLVSQRTSVTSGLDHSIFIGADGLPILAYHQWGNGRLFAVKCFDAACSNSNNVASFLVRSGSPGSIDIGLQIGSDGKPVFSFLDDVDKILKMGHCETSSCVNAGNRTVTTTINEPSHNVPTGLHSSIAIGHDDLPVIAYLDYFGYYDQQFRVAKCNDKACSGGDEVITTIAVTGETTVYDVDLVIGLDGNPVVSFIPFSDRINVVKCNDPSCLGNDEIETTIINLGFTNIGEDSSMALGTDGFPGDQLLQCGRIFIKHCQMRGCFLFW